MIKRSDKKGQFYLLSAIIIISIIIGFSAVSTYTKTSEVKIFDLGEELDIESTNVLDYGAYNAVEDLDTLLNNFASNYSEYIGEDKELSFVFGNPEDDSVTVINYEEVILGEVDYAGSKTTTRKRVSNKSSSDIEIETNSGKKITKIRFKNREYEIELKPGENFYFVISQEVGEEVHTTTSK
ncbi:MAG: hypothetical protein ABFQ65_01625 [Nanoarchaeota archaeon]